VGKVIDYLEYLKAQNFNTQTINKILVMVDHMHPKIEALLYDEIAKMYATKELYDVMKDDNEVRSLFDFTVVTSLCFILSQYLVALADRPNNLNVTKDNLEMVVTNLIQGMVKNAI